MKVVFHHRMMRVPLAAAFAASVTLVAAAVVPASRNSASPPPQQTADEVVANLAAGRVAILVAKDGIAIATAQSQVEPGTLPPLIVPLGSLRVAVLLGPAVWEWPGTTRAPLRLDVELRRGQPATREPTAQKYEMPATDIEGIGLGFLEPLRNAAGLLHGPLHLQPHELFTELMLVGYAPNYGPEVWSLRYHAEQELLRGDFYRTSVHRPEYVQLYPPDRGQPKTLVESAYPPNDPGEPPILDLLRANDSRLAPLRSADPGMGRAADLLLQGESQKVKFDDGLELLRAAFQSVSPPEAKQMIVAITEQKGMQWVLGESELSPLAPQDQKKAESGAPTLRKKPGPR